ncbi:MAG: hypothetical protein IH851_09425 [Armatimonadetes bacterium]|nr:hypothetical protein [Armatimonadota bacterium]
MGKWLAGLADLDVRWLYAALLASIVLTAYIRVHVTIELSPESEGFYTALEQQDGTKPVLLHSDWDQGTIGELSAQFRAIVRHLFEKDLRFVVISGIPQGAEFYEPVIQELADEYGKEYGRDWIAVGYKLADPKDIAIEALSRDFPELVQTDARGKRPTEFPWLRDVRVADDWGLVISVAYTEYRGYITYFYEAAGTPYVCGVTAIISTTLYPFITAGNIKGMLVGSRGGGEYEQKMGQYGFGSRMLLGESAGHLLLLIGVILANVGEAARRRRRGREESAE